MTIWKKLLQSVGLKGDLWHPILKLGWFGGSREYRKTDYFYGIVFTCIDALATPVSNTPVQLFKEKKDGERDEIFNHAALDVLNKPTSFHTRSDFIYYVSSHLEVYGESWIWPRLNKLGEPVELWPLDPTRIEVKEDKDEFIAGYVYHVSPKEKIPFKVGEIFPIMQPNPFNYRRGVSTLEMARHEIEGDLDSTTFSKQFFKQGAMPSGVLSTEGKLADDSFKRLEEQFRKKYQGKENAYKAMVLEGGLKYQQLSLSQRDMDYIEQKRFSRDQIMAIFKTPKVVLGISDDVNRANADAGFYVFNKTRIKPRLQLIYGKLNEFLIPMFKNSDGLYYEPEDTVPEDRELKLKERTESVNRWKTVNEIRAEDNLPPVPGGYSLFVPLNLVPLTDSSTPEEKPEEEKAVKIDKDLALARKLFKANTMKSKRDQNYLAHKHRYTDRVEEQLAAALKQIFNDLIRSVGKKDLRTVKSKGVEETLLSLLPDLEKWTQTLSLTILGYITDVYKEAQNQTGGAYNLTIDFNLENSGAIAWLKSQSNTSAYNVRDTMLNKARSIIADQLEQPNFSLGKARDAIKEVFKDEELWRVERIARNEVHNAYAESARRLYESNRVEQYQWLALRDACEICRPNDGQIVKAGENFSSGHAFNPAHIQCRCDVLPYFGAN